MNPKKPSVFFFLLIAAVCSASPLRAGIVINMVESGPDVVATLSGSINTLTGATPYTTNNPTGMLSGFRASGPVMLFAFATQSGFPLINMNYYAFTNIPTNFGTSSDLKLASSSTASANMLFRNMASEALYIDPNYVLGTPVTGALTWNNQSFASLGVTQGSYLWSWGGDSMTLNIGAAPAAVPEPGTWAAAALLVGAAGYARLRKRAKVS